MAKGWDEVMEGSRFESQYEQKNKMFTYQKTFFLIGKPAGYIEKIGRIQSIKDILYLRSKFKLKHHINIYLFLLSAYFPNH